MDLIGKVLLVFFLVMGLIETCRLLLMWLLRPEKIADSILVIPMCGHVEDAEYLLRGAAESIRWEKHKRPRRFICVDGGMDRETKEICKKNCHVWKFADRKNWEALCFLKDKKKALKRN